MAFKINKRPSYTWPVVYKLPIDGGKHETSTFDVDFKYLPQSELKKMLSDPAGNDIDFCKTVVVGWKNVMDKTEEIPFSESALEQILEEPGLAKCIASAYLESHAGAKAKN